MTTPLAVFALYATQTADEWLEYGLGLARVVGLPVESWRVGDPTRSLYKYVAEALATRDQQDAEYVRAGFLSTVEGDWATIHALEVYGVERGEETFATPTVTIENTGGGRYPIAAGELTVQASSTGKTYHNTDVHVEPGDLLEGGATITFSLVADEGGSASSVLADEIDTIVSPSLLGCAITGSTAATAQDEQSLESLKEDCRDTLGALSPNGPADAYEYVVRQSSLTGVDDITRSQSTSDATNLTVTVYLASDSGQVAGASVTAAQNAIEEWAAPLCVTPTAVNSTEQSINLTATISGEGLPGDAEDQIEAALTTYLSTLAIGGYLSRSRLFKLIHDTVGAAVSVTISAPAADVDLGVGVVAVPGTVSVVEV